MRRLALSFAVLLFAIVPAAAERLIIALSTSDIRIDSGFTGDAITVFGVIERDAATVSRASAYDVAVVVRGPSEPVVAPTKRGRPKKAAAEAAPGAPRKTRDDTKQAQLIAMLRRKEGATIAQIVAATGWLPHTVRGAFAGALKKKLGLTVTSEKVEGIGRVYRLDSEAGR